MIKSLFNNISLCNNINERSPLWSGARVLLWAMWVLCGILIHLFSYNLLILCSPCVALHYCPKLVSNRVAYRTLSCLSVCVCVCTDLISTPHLTPFCGTARIRCILWSVPLIRSHDWTACRRHISIYCIWATARPTFDLLMMRGKDLEI